MTDKAKVKLFCWEGWDQCPKRRFFLPHRCGILRVLIRHKHQCKFCGKIKGK